MKKIKQLFSKLNIYIMLLTVHTIAYIILLYYFIYYYLNCINCLFQAWVIDTGKEDFMFITMMLIFSILFIFNTIYFCYEIKQEILNKKKENGK